MYIYNLNVSSTAFYCKSDSDGFIILGYIIQQIHPVFISLYFFVYKIFNLYIGMHCCSLLFNNKKILSHTQKMSENKTEKCEIYITT